MDLSIDIGNSKERSDDGYTLKIEPTGLSDGVFMRWVMMRRINDDSKVFNFSDLNDKVVFACNLKGRGRVSLRRKMRLFTILNVFIQVIY